MKLSITIIHRLIFLLVPLAFCSSCQKLVEVDAPESSTNSENVYRTDGTAIAVLTGVYSTISTNPLSSGTSLNSFMTLYPGLSADELVPYSSANINYVSYYKNALNPSSAPNIWRSQYPVIYVLNAAIEGLERSSTLTPAVKQRLLGEAKFLRGFAYFYLTNLYENIPLATGTDYRINGRLSKTPQEDVYKQIIADLLSAQSLLSDNYVGIDVTTVTTDRVRPNKAAAQALLARTYLYTKDWNNAELQATAVISNSLYDTVPLNQVFLKESREAIWQLQPVNIGWNTEYARMFVLPASGVSTTRPVYLSPWLLANFENGDRRSVLGNWIQRRVVGANTYYYSYKYKSATLNAPVTEYHTVIRLAEQYLIRAEARARQGKLDDARSDLNVIRARAGLPSNTMNDQPGLLAAILHERQVELFTEWGHRWLDLKRTGMADTVMGTITPLKGGAWDPNWKLYPISPPELLSNPNIRQNDGY